MDVAGRMRDYEGYLRQKGLSEGTIASYVWVAAYFERTYGPPEAETLQLYRAWLVKTFKACTANQRVQAINCYLSYLDLPDLRLKNVRVQQRTYLDKTISDADYQRLTAYLLSSSHLRDYFAVRLMATTGARVSELLQMDVDHVRLGYMDINSKGKVRRIHIPSATCDEALVWLAREGRDQGLILLNRYGRPITPRGLSQQLKARAGECGLDVASVHPHAFRHLFARRFLEAGGDISFLADLLGHSSVETTRIYLRRTAAEQHDELNRLVSW